MKAVRFEGPDGTAHLGALDGEVVHDAGPLGAAGFIPSAEGWARLAAADGEARPVGELRLRHPVVPSKILGIGLNYRAHAVESELEIPDVPVVFAKLPSALVGPGDAIVIPREEPRPDWEGEVAVVIGTRTYRADRAGAHAAIGGISAINDVTGRRAQYETPLRQFTFGKSFDTFAPLGPAIASIEDVDLADIDVRTTVSGELMQDGNTRDLIFSIVDIIVYLSAGITLEPGDVIATGTPSGVGDSRVPPRYLREGDVVEITVAGVGTLSNPVTLER